MIWLHAGESLVSDIPGQLAVPGFFILSGVLFFRDFRTGEKPACMLLKEKLLRRLRTLLLPYLLWNLLYFFVYLVTGRAEPREFFRAVFFYSCNPVFWYLYQLILITALTPLLWIILKRKLPALLFLAAVFLAAVFYAPIHGRISFSYCNEDALFYYALGAFFALHCGSASALSAACSQQQTGRLPGLSGGSVSALSTVRSQQQKVSFQGLNSESNPALSATGESGSPEEQAPTGAGPSQRNLRTLAASALLFLLTGALGAVLPPELMNVSVIGLRCTGVCFLWHLLRLLKLPEPRPWMKITFFIYAVHYLLIRVVWTAEAALGLNGSAAANILTYLLMPVFCTAASYGMYLLMKRFTPRFLRLLTGGRGIDEGAGAAGGGVTGDGSG